jgi:diguanylate cyclase (GGDEF)-like protein
LNNRWLKKRGILIVLFIISGLTLFGALTDPWLHLRYFTVGIKTDGPFPLLSFTRGPLYWSHVCYTFIAFALGTGLLVRNMFTTPRFFRNQLFFMLAGSCLPWINYFLYLLGFPSNGIDTIPFSVSLSAACFGIAIFGYKILDVIPIARGLVFEKISDAVIVLDNANLIVDYNRAAANVFPELSQDSLSGDVRTVLSKHTGLYAFVDSTVEMQFQFTSGEERSLKYYDCTISPIYSRTNTSIGKIILFKDNTETTVLLAKLKTLATIDPLTQVYNRRHFIEIANRQLSHHARDGRALSIIILDLDFFKQVNDTYGHLAGDEVLRTIANLLTLSVRGGDSVARFGGEEFICLLAETGGKEAFLVAERMREEIGKAHFSIPGFQDISITGSFGICSVEKVAEGEKLDPLIARADFAMYRAKEQGRNKTVLYRDGLKEKV